MGIWPPLFVSALSGGAFAVAMLSGWRLGDTQGDRARHALENRAALAAATAFLLLLIAVVLWVAYLIFGPVQDVATQLLEVDR